MTKYAETICSREKEFETRTIRRETVTHTFVHVPMSYVDNKQYCQHCRLITNGELYMVPWPCAFAILHERDTDKDGATA